jgi:hypothetical protein
MIGSRGFWDWETLNISEKLTIFKHSMHSPENRGPFDSCNPTINVPGGLGAVRRVPRIRVADFRASDIIGAASFPCKRRPENQVSDPAIRRIFWNADGSRLVSTFSYVWMGPITAILTFLRALFFGFKGRKRFRFPGENGC